MWGGHGESRMELPRGGGWRAVERMRTVDTELRTQPAAVLLRVQRSERARGKGLAAALGEQRM